MHTCISLATKTISSREGVMRPDRPSTSAPTSCKTNMILFEPKPIHRRSKKRQRHGKTPVNQARVLKKAYFMASQTNQIITTIVTRKKKTDAIFCSWDYLSNNPPSPLSKVAKCLEKTRICYADTVLVPALRYIVCKHGRQKPGQRLN